MTARSKGSGTGSRAKCPGTPTGEPGNGTEARDRIATFSIRTPRTSGTTRPAPTSTNTSANATPPGNRTYIPAMTSLADWKIDDLKLIYRVLHAHLMDHAELMDSD